MKYIIPYFLLSVFYFTLPLISAVSQTLVGGVITNNTTWNLAGSPYIVTGSNIIVDNGVTLTIDAGVIVKFDATRSIQIDGMLRAIGTYSQPILITSNKVNPQAGDWGASFSSTATVLLTILAMARAVFCNIALLNMPVVLLLTIMQHSDLIMRHPI